MLQVVTPRIFSLVCFRLLPPNNNEDHGNNLNHDLLDAVNSTGKIFISHTVRSMLLLYIFSAVTKMLMQWFLLLLFEFIIYLRERRIVVY